MSVLQLVVDARAGLAVTGLVWTGLVWAGLVWAGLVWTGLVWAGLAPADVEVSDLQVSGLGGCGLAGCYLMMLFRCLGHMLRHLGEWLGSPFRRAKVRVIVLWKVVECHPSLTVVECAGVVVGSGVGESGHRGRRRDPS